MLAKAATAAPRTEPSVASVGDRYDNALAETVIGLFKTEVIYWRVASPRRSATSPRAEPEQRYFEDLDATAVAA
jgi:transposase InsO family protein